jgi:hypothetical protein
MQKGLQVSLAASIDFTGSNGDPRRPNSLHYMDPTKPNQYVRAVMSVGDVLMEYDSDKQVPAFGFGAQLPDRTVSHFFNLNFQQNPHVFGVQGILDSYGQAITQVRFAGPTNFAPTIRSVTEAARATVGYTILLILTDGEITDMQQTVDAITNADDAPLSIIIVGVGNADFGRMDVLDGDDEPLHHSNGRFCRRDLVQFVPFNRYTNAPPEVLAAEVLREVPDQVVQWGIMTKTLPQSFTGQKEVLPPDEVQT